MLLDEIRQLLRELASDIGATRTEVVHSRPMSRADNVRISALGGGAFLCVELASGDGADGIYDRRLQGQSDLQVAAAMTRCVRALRACARRWECARVPVCADSRSADMPVDRVRERIVSYLQALANGHGAHLVLVTVGRDIAAASSPPDELSRERIPFIVRRVEVEAGRRKRSHADVVTVDTYAQSFWFDACLIAYFSQPFAEDFIRHRTRLVTRELIPLLTMLDDPPPSPAQVAPVPTPE